jgi:hypothetical protein
VTGLAASDHQLRALNAAWQADIEWVSAGCIRLHAFVDATNAVFLSGKLGVGPGCTLDWPCHHRRQE